MLAPLVAVIVFLALYPQLALHRSEGSVDRAIARAQLYERRWLNARRLPSAEVQRLEAGAQRTADKHGERVRRVSRDLRWPIELAPLLATTHLKGPHVDFAGLSPLIALLGGAVVVLLVGLVGSRWVRARLRPGAEPRGARRSARPDDLAVERGQVDRLGRASHRRPVARLNLVLIVGGPARSLLAWRSLAAHEAAHGEFHALLLTSIGGMSLLAPPRTRSPCSSASSCCRSRCTCCARPK